MDAQQDLFTAVRGILVDLFGENSVYDGCLPPEGTPYPFAYLGNVRQSDRPLKNAERGDVTLLVHIFHDNVRERGKVSDWLFAIKRETRALEETANWSWQIRQVDSQILPDNTTSTPLLHGVVDLKYQYS